MKKRKNNSLISCLGGPPRAITLEEGAPGKEVH